MKERLTSRKIVHLAIVLAILLGLVAYRTWFGNVQTAVEGSEKIRFVICPTPAATPGWATSR